MLIEESQQRQKNLRDYLLEMASLSMDEDAIRSMAIKLKALYSDGFRHNYSEFFPLIVEISKDENEYNLDFLSTNLEDSRALVEQDYISGEKEFKGLYKPLSKLSDHLNLEIGRYSYYSRSEQQVRDLERRNQSLRDELKSATEELRAAQKTVSTMQTELITVLSIFAAIVLTFSGSLSFIGNALNGMSDTSFFKATFFVLLCGIVVFNLIFLLMYIVGKITSRNIYARCESENCTCGENGKPKCKGITRIRKRLPYIYWVNFTLLFLIALDIAAWCFNMNYLFLPF